MLTCVLIFWTQFLTIMWQVLTNQAISPDTDMFDRMKIIQCLRTNDTGDWERTLWEMQRAKRRLIYPRKVRDIWIRFYKGRGWVKAERKRNWERHWSWWSGTLSEEMFLIALHLFEHQTSPIQNTGSFYTYFPSGAPVRRAVPFLFFLNGRGSAKL